MKIDLSLKGEQVTAAVVTMILAACADLDVSDTERERVKDIVVRRTSWADDATTDRLIDTAEDRIQDIGKLSDDRGKLLAALRNIGGQIGDLAAREAVLALALEVAAADGLDDDEALGMSMLIEAFGADEDRVHALAKQGG
jgi:tellurite resistance protein